MTSEKELCECGCGRAADNTIWTMSSHELAGARYRLACADGKMFERIRARRAIGVRGDGLVTLDGGRTYGASLAYVTLGELTTPLTHSDLYERVIKECEAAISAAILPQGLLFVADEKQDIVKTGVLKGRLEEHYPETITMTIGFTPRTVNCLSCSSPATHGDYCVYCANSTDDGGDEDKAWIDRVTAQQMQICQMSDGTPIPGEAAARARMAVADAREKPRSTATSRELAKGHPITWPSEDGEW